jgi:hypothetical protein
MKNRVLGFRINNFILCFSFLFAKSLMGLNSKDDLLVRRDEVNNKITFYLNQSGVITDSLSFHGLNFGVDSLKRLSDNLWHYIYSVRCGSGCKLQKQIMLISDDNKLRISYASYLWSSYDYRELYSNNLNNNNALPNPIYCCLYTFVDSLIFTKPTIKEYIYKGKTLDNGSNGTTIYYQLKYNSLKKIYYTEKQVLSGEYVIVASRNNKEIKKKINTVVFALKFKETQWLYYDDVWYELNQKRKRLIKFE